MHRIAVVPHTATCLVPYQPPHITPPDRSRPPTSQTATPTHRTMAQQLCSRGAASCACSSRPAPRRQSPYPLPQPLAQPSSLAPSSRHAPSTSARLQRAHALPEGSSINLKEIADMLAVQAPLEDEQISSMEQIADALETDLGSVKFMVFKRKALAGMSGAEIKGKVQQIAAIVGVTPDQARQMVIIQPGLLFDTQKQAETLEYGIRAICYELGAPKEEVVELIIKNQSVLHGRQMHLSVADIAHLAMLREPKSRVMD